jgi:hypothetical protein
LDSDGNSDGAVEGIKLSDGEALESSLLSSSSGEMGGVGAIVVSMLADGTAVGTEVATIEFASVGDVVATRMSVTVGTGVD